LPEVNDVTVHELSKVVSHESVIAGDDDDPTSIFVIATSPLAIAHPQHYVE
jgi:hypothetical protein